MSGKDGGAETPGDIGCWPCTCRLTHHLVGPPCAEGVTATQEANPERRDCEGEANCMSGKCTMTLAPLSRVPVSARLGNFGRNKFKVRERQWN